MALPSGTTATTAGPAPTPPSPRDARGRPLQSARSGGWRRQRCRSGRQLGSPGQPLPTPGRQPGDLRRPRRPPRPPRLQALPPRSRRWPQAHRGLRPQPQQAAPRPGARPAARRQREVGPGAGPRRLAGSRRSRRGGRGGYTRRSDRGPREPHHRPGRPRRGPQHAAGAGDGPR